MKKVILIIDDDEDDRYFFGEAVQEVDKTSSIICCENGEDALNLLKKEDTKLPDYIFLDINMPGISGKNCLIELKKLEKLTKTPVFMYSTSSQKKDDTEFKKLGAAHYFTKPCHYTEIKQIISFVTSNNWQ